jgi:hypothetical protein
LCDISFNRAIDNLGAREKKVLLSLDFSVAVHRDKDLHEQEVVRDPMTGQRQIFSIIGSLDDGKRDFGWSELLGDKRTAISRKFFDKRSLSWRSKSAQWHKLLAKGIRTWDARPRTPEHDGTTERFWRILDEIRDPSSHPPTIETIFT